MNCQPVKKRRTQQEGTRLHGLKKIDYILQQKIEYIESLLHLRPKINLMKIGFQEFTVLIHPHERKKDCDQSRTTTTMYHLEE